MTTILYDGSFEGLLTAIFEVYEYKFLDVNIFVAGGVSNSLFGVTHQVQSCPEKAERVLKKINKELGTSIAKKIYEAYLCEDADIANVLFRFVRYGLQRGAAACEDFSNRDVLFVHQILKKVHRERHRMEAFIRFQQAEYGLFFARISPDFDVLPLIKKHFKSRYADQRWLIYDDKRNYGMLYDLQDVFFVNQAKHSPAAGQLSPAISLHEEEIKFQELWKQYFNSVNIKERKNMALHVRHMPKRYWKYLTEKQ